MADILEGLERSCNSNAVEAPHPETNQKSPRKSPHSLLDDGFAPLVLSGTFYCRFGDIVRGFMTAHGVSRVCLPLAP